MRKRRSNIYAVSDTTPPKPNNTIQYHTIMLLTLFAAAKEVGKWKFFTEYIKHRYIIHAASPEGWLRDTKAFFFF